MREESKYCVLTCVLESYSSPKQPLCPILPKRWMKRQNEMIHQNVINTVWPPPVCRTSEKAPAPESGWTALPPLSKKWHIQKETSCLHHERIKYQLKSSLPLYKEVPPKSWVTISVTWPRSFSFTGISLHPHKSDWWVSPVFVSSSENLRSTHPCKPVVSFCLPGTVHLTADLGLIRGLQSIN